MPKKMTERELDDMPTYVIYGTIEQKNGKSDWSPAQYPLAVMSSALSLAKFVNSPPEELARDVAHARIQHKLFVQFKEEHIIFDVAVVVHLQ